MRLALVLFVFLTCLTGCRLPPERRAAAPVARGRWPLFFSGDAQPRPRPGERRPGSLLHRQLDRAGRCRGRAWSRPRSFLPQTVEQPAPLRQDIPQAAANLRKEAVRLGEAARARTSRALTKPFSASPCRCGC